MLPFSKRPAPPEETFLSTGDFEAVQRPTIPPPARVPVFARSMEPVQALSQPPPSYGYGSASMMSSPPPPNSLAPVAMGGYGVGATGPHPRSVTGTGPAATVVIRTKPSMRWGMMIALAGVMLGGALGITFNSKHHARAAAHVQAQSQDAPPAIAPPAPVPQTVAAPSAPGAAGPTVLPQTPPSTPPSAYAGGVVVPPSPVLVPGKTKKGGAPAVTPPHKATPSEAAPQHGMVATKVTAPVKTKPAEAEAPSPPKTKDNSEAVDLLNRAKKEASQSL